MDIPTPRGRAAPLSLNTPRQRGYTLIEALTALGVAAVMLGTAVPGMQNLLDKNRIAGEVNHFLGHLHYARSEAIKRNRTVIVCQSGDGAECESLGGWHHGWMIYVDRDGDRERDDDEAILTHVSALDSPETITSGRRRNVVYKPTGFSPGSNATFTICNPRKPELARAIVLSNTGRTRLATETPRGDPLPCG